MARICNLLVVTVAILSVASCKLLPVDNPLQSHKADAEPRDFLMSIVANKKSQTEAILESLGKCADATLMGQDARKLTFGSNSFSIYTKYLTDGLASQVPNLSVSDVGILVLSALPASKPEPSLKTPPIPEEGEEENGEEGAPQQVEDSSIYVTDTGADREYHELATILKAFINSKYVVVLVTDLDNPDLATKASSTFEQIKSKFYSILKILRFPASRREFPFIPVPLSTGTNICDRSSDFSWYSGNTLKETLSLVPSI